jgi:hypothetical protein
VHTAAGTLLSFQDGDGVPKTLQFVCRRQTCQPGAKNENALRVSLALETLEPPRYQRSSDYPLEKLSTSAHAD